MDGEEDEFMSGNHSDDGGGTPVQDEHPPSDADDARSDRHQSEDEGSNDEAAQPMDTSGAMSDSDGETARKDPDDDSENEAEKEREEHSENETKDRDPSSDFEQTKERDDASGSDDDDNNEESPRKRPSSVSEDESPTKRAQSDQEGEPSSSPKRRRGSTSDADGDGEGAGGTGNGNKAASDSESEKHDSDSDGGVRKKKRLLDSDDEEEEREKKGEEGEREGGGGEEEGEKESGKWKGVMQSDSEEEEGERTKAHSDGEQDGGQKDSDDEDRPVKRKKAILSDSEDEEEEKTDKPVKRSRAVSDGDDSDSASSAAGPDKSLAAKLRELGSASEDEEEEEPKTEVKKDEKALFGSDSDSGDEEEKMIADIFGESGDEEEEEFTGFNQEDLEQEKKETPQTQQQQDDSDSDEGVDRSGQDTSFMSDFDIMLAKRKAMNSKRRKHRDGGTFISDADDVVSAMINKMNEAAEEDRTLNSQKKPALKKLTLLPQVVMHLKKQDLKETFIDSGVMSAIKEWISPLPDKSLPALRIREELLRILQELPSVSQETLKHSGIGRAVMFLYKHPKESRTNKDLALKLINEWSRPIFGLTSNYKGMTREERQQRDLDQQMPQRRRLSSGGQTPRRDLEKQLTGEEKALRPGDPGFCARARVPMPSNKDYVVRPKWNVEGDSSRGPVKKGLSRVDKQMRRFQDIRRLSKTGHAVKISVEGNRMPL
ncbi:LOW QUALITY PROTEIN: protein IWS1 homolog [Boleophthalmus pectinirostris]|uniref:LOW QUALITY PROTEIN: protein IWS1 homolog n=1 Tax=Boleophthalmus pectinirostris TaxID=150288 RepID=UPI002431B971|nr:LOW QUALITY PROTEIN: protein IWS1 homolog [Boleophthalmus pectinirostris]